MKKLFILTAGLILMSLSSNAKAQTYTAMENQIYAAANHACLNDWRQLHGGLINFTTEVFAPITCVGGNEGLYIEIYAFVECPPQHRLYCKPAPPFHVASGTMDCAGNITIDCIVTP